MSDTLLEVTQLSVNRLQKSITKEDALVKGIDVKLTKGTVTGIIGESGSGKSLSMKALMGLLPDGLVADFKDYRFEGQTVENANQLPISMIFQDPMTALNPLRTVSFHLAEIIFRRDETISNEDAEKLAIKVLKQVGITEPEQRLQQYPFELSGGLRQRILIAMALLSEPSVLIADEPTTALDVTIQAQILNLLRDLQEQTDLTIVLVSHDFGVIAGLCDEVKVMYQGRVVEEGKVEEIFYSPSHPYTKRLLQAAELDYSSLS